MPGLRRRRPRRRPRRQPAADLRHRRRRLLPAPRDRPRLDRGGVVAAFQVDANNQPVAGGFFERVNYDGDINGGLQIFGRDGDDTFVLDDNLAPTTIFGDDGNDTFQIGQVFQSARDGSNPDNGLAPDDFFQTTLTTRGFLSNGISETTTLFGGTGNDSFTVYHNLAELFLFGEEDDDTFLVRAFVRVNPNDPKAPFTNINGGQGADFISLHGQRAGAHRRRRRPRHARRRRHRVRRRLRGHRQGRLRRRPLHHLRRASRSSSSTRRRATTASSSRSTPENVVARARRRPRQRRFNVGGTNGQPITVVANSLAGPQRPDRHWRLEHATRTSTASSSRTSRCRSPTTTRPAS